MSGLHRAMRRRFSRPSAAASVSAPQSPDGSATNRLGSARPAEELPADVSSAPRRPVTGRSADNVAQGRRASTRPVRPPITVPVRPHRMMLAGLPVACLVAFGAAPVAGEAVALRASEVASVSNSDWVGLLGLSWPQADPSSGSPAYDAVGVGMGVPAVLPTPQFSPTNSWWSSDSAGSSGYGYGGGSVQVSNAIPLRAFQAYLSAANRMATLDAACQLPWWVLAGIGRVESNHGRYGGSVVTTSGRVMPGILGIRLDGSRAGTATISDSDNGRYDGDTAYDRAVGPMQFLPGTWSAYGADGNGDRLADPQNIDDAALGAARYLCAGSSDLSTDAGRVSAVLRYNRSMSYARLVLSLGAGYAGAMPIDARPTPADPGGPSTPSPTPSPTTPTPTPTTPSPTPTTPKPTPTTSSPTTSPSPSTSTTSPSPSTTTTSPSPTTSTTSPSPSETTSSPAPTTSTTSPTQTPTQTPATSTTTSSPAATPTPDASSATPAPAQSSTTCPPGATPSPTPIPGDPCATASP